MISYAVDKWIRYAMATMAFAMVLILTPRALLDVSNEADSHEIPVDMLEPADDCLWCTPPEWNPAQHCDEEALERQWLNPDETAPRNIDAECGDIVTIPDYS